MIPALDLPTIYEAPARYHAEGLDTQVLKVFGITDAPMPDLSRWKWVVERVKNPEGEVRIAVVGKYMQVKDSYKSLSEALTHGGLANNVRVHMDWIDSEVFERDDAAVYLENVSGILVPGGFGERGTEGKIEAVKFARERGVPFFGICYGLHMAVIETARDLAGLGRRGHDGNRRAAPSGHRADDGMDQGQRSRDARGRRRSRRHDAARRLSGRAEPGSRVAEIYGANEISERHRHRYEVNVGYTRQLAEHGFVVSGWSPDKRLPEIMEIPNHPWFIGVQFHPELKSRPFAPHPLFSSFVAAAVKQSRLV